MEIASKKLQRTVHDFPQFVAHGFDLAQNLLEEPLSEAQQAVVDFVFDGTRKMREENNESLSDYELRMLTEHDSGGRKGACGSLLIVHLLTLLSRAVVSVVHASSVPRRPLACRREALSRDLESR